MAKHRKDDEFDSVSGDLTKGELKPQLAEKSDPLEAMAEVSLSPMETS